MFSLSQPCQWTLLPIQLPAIVVSGVALERPPGTAMFAPGLSVSSLHILACPTARGAAHSAALQVLLSCRCKLAQWSAFATAAGCPFWFRPARRCRALVCPLVNACLLPAWLHLTALCLLSQLAPLLSSQLCPSILANSCRV